MDFKYGAVKMSKETNKLLVPFAINNKYKFLRKSVSITIGKPYLVKGDLEKENKILMNKVLHLLKEK